MKDMHDLRKTIRYGLLLILGVIVLCVGMIQGTGTVRAEIGIWITNFVKIFYIPATAVEIGSKKEDIREKLGLKTVSAYCSDGSVRDIPVKWDLSSLDPGKPGICQIQGRPQIPEELLVADETSVPVYTTWISIQSFGQPEINAYSFMESSGIFVFPWISGLDTEHMAVWLRREGNGWIDLTEAGYAVCMEDGLYLANTAMTMGKSYELAVSGKGFQTRILKFEYESDNVLKIRNYRSGSILGIAVPEKKIRSVEETDPRMDQRCMAFALETGEELKDIRETLTKDMILFGSTAETYENTAENPARAMHAVWDISGVNIREPGIYKIAGKFQAPEGYALAETLALPEMTAYVSIQDPDAPEINTYYMPEGYQILFPVVMKNIWSFDPEVWIRENDNSWVKMTQTQGELREDGIALFRNSLQQGGHYQLCLTWNGGSTGIYSFDFGGDFITNENWIRRNFANRDGQTFPDISLDTTITPEAQKPESQDTDAVTHPSENIQKDDTQKDNIRKDGDTINDKDMQLSEEQPARKVTEVVTEKWTVISGKRLGLILKYMGDVNFEKDGISLRIPVSVAQSWELAEEGTVQTLVQKTSDHSYEVKIYKGDQEITDISGSRITIPVKEIFPEEDPETMEITDSKGKKLKTSLDKKQNLLTVCTDETGTFHVRGQKTDIEEKPFAAAAMTAATVLIVGIRSRSGKRGDSHQEEK